MKTITTIAGIFAIGLFYGVPAFAADDKGTTQVKGEILDLMCYLDHGASGAKHTECAKMCITNGGPVGIKDKDGKVYLVVGEHAPVNKTLAAEAGKTVTLKGKVVSRDGINMLENAEVVGK